MKIIYVRLLMLIILTTFILCSCGNKQDTLCPDDEEHSEAEVSTEQERVVLEEIGVTLILPDSWKGKYEVIEGICEPYNSTMWEFCVKSIYDAQTPIDESEQVVYRGTLFAIFQYADYFMSEEEFEQSGIAGIGRYLFATENATYAVMHTTDMQYDWNNTGQKEEWNAMEQSIQDIQFVIEAEETELKATDDTQLLSGLNNRVIETVLKNGETGSAVTASDVVIDQTIYGSFSEPETEEVLVICKILNMPHVGGLNRRAIIILEDDSMDMVAYAEIPADEVWVGTLPMSNGQDRIIFSGKTTYQGISVQEIMYFCIQDGQWTEIPAAELETLGEDCFYYLAGDKMIVTSGRELADSSDITAILTWNQDAGEFTLEHADNYASEILAYIEDLDADIISVDEIEWVTVPGSRADELGITEEDAPSGFYIYNPDTLIMQFALTVDCTITILDWQNSFEPQTISVEDFITVLQERGEQNIFIPYSLEIANGKIIKISEHYVP